MLVICALPLLFVAFYYIKKLPHTLAKEINHDNLACVSFAIKLAQRCFEDDNDTNNL